MSQAPLTESDDNGVDVGALLEKAADRFSACMDAKIESIWERTDKRIEDKVDSKLGPMMDRLSALEKTGWKDFHLLHVKELNRQRSFSEEKDIWK